MRPSLTDQASYHPHKSSTSDNMGLAQSSSTQEEPDFFFLSRNDDTQRSRSRSPEAPTDTPYGVQSLEESMKLSSHEPAHAASDTRDLGIDNGTHPPLCRTTTVRPASSHSAGLGDPSALDAVPSLPMTPLLNPSTGVSPLPTSPKSTSTRSNRRYDEISISDGSMNQAVEWSDEESVHSIGGAMNPVPQLVMPSISMPSRRPFTERGKSLGRLKVMVAGSSGSGKTSLLRSIVQTCEDIVHIDSHPQSNLSFTRRRKKPRRSRPQPHVAEILASTKPYPSWLTDLEDSRVLRRRKSNGDLVLERNLCFVDTIDPGIDPGEQTAIQIRYMAQQFKRAATSIASANADFQGLLSGNGGSQVDVILYLVTEDTMTYDIQCIKKLSEYSSVVPLLAKTDTLSSTQIQDLKASFLDNAREASLPNFWGESLDADIDHPSTPFTVSSANTNDDEMMDASVLMSSDYVQPLAPSDLGYLLNKIFDPDNILWFRHSAAKKLLLAHNLHGLRTEQQVATPVSAVAESTFPPFTSSPFSSLSHSQVREPSSSRSVIPEYTLARIADHTRREERLAQIELAKWATDLQRSLQNERERYEKLTHKERARWLANRLDECVEDGTLVPLGQAPASERGKNIFTVRHRDGRRVRYRVADDVWLHDPLGLIRLTDTMRRRGWALLQILGSVGIIGGLAYWLARTLGYTPQDLPNWIRTS